MREFFPPESLLFMPANLVSIVLLNRVHNEHLLPCLTLGLNIIAFQATMSALLRPKSALNPVNMNACSFLRVRLCLTFEAKISVFKRG